MRITFVIAAWAFVLAIAVQVFLAGVGVFASMVDSFQYHRALGWMLPLGPMLLLLLGAAAQAGRRTMWLLATLLFLMIVQMILPELRRGLPLVAALHPVNALAIFTVALIVARRATILSSIRDEGRPVVPRVSATLDSKTAHEG